MKLVLLLVFWFTTAVSINVDKCCPLNSVFDVSTNKCFAFNSSITISETSLLFNKHKPKIFSLESEDFIEEGISATDYRLPSCPAGEKYTIIQNIEDEENFVLIKEDGSLFKTEDGSTEAMFCIDSIIRQNTVVGHLAVLCGISEEKVCSGLFCINNCCPEGTVYKTNLGECQPTSEFKFPQLLKETVKSVNPTLPGEGWEDSLKIYYREPNCSHLHIYSEDEFEVEAEGWLRAGQTILPYTQFCLNPVQQYNSTVLQAKVCSGIDENDLLIYSVLSQQIIPVLIILSEIFLFLTFSLHVLVPEFRKQIFGWMKMCTVASLFLSYQWFLIILFGGDLLIQEYPALCQLMGFLIQFCFLCSFTWMTTMSIEVWLTFRKLTANSETDARQRSQRRRFKQYNLFSFGAPLLVTVCTIAVHFTPDHLKENIISPGFGEGSCFIEGYLAKILYFHGLIALLLAVNLVLFIISAYSLLLGVWAPARDEQGSRRINGQMTWIVFELFLVMGLTWGSEILTISIDWAHSTSHYLGAGAVFFDVINSLQGFFIFVVLVCKPRMRAMIKARLKPMIECGKGSSRDSVDGNTRSKEPHLSPKTLSTSVLKTEISLKELNPNQELRPGPGEEPGAEPEPGSRLKASKSHSIFGKRGSYSLETEEKEENGVTTLSFQHTQTDSFS